MGYQKKVALGSQAHSLLNKEIAATMSVLSDVIPQYLGTNPLKGKTNPNPKLNPELFRVTAKNGDSIEVTITESAPRQPETWNMWFHPKSEDRRLNPISLSAPQLQQISHYLVVRIAHALDLVMDKLVELYPPAKEEFEQYCAIHDAYSSS